MATLRTAIGATTPAVTPCAAASAVDVADDTEDVGQDGPNAPIHLAADVDDTDCVAHALDELEPDHDVTSKKPRHTY
jgi:hypothetical protein